MSKKSETTLPTILDRFDALDMALIQARTLIEAFIVGELYGPNENVDPAAYLDIVAEKQGEAQRLSRELWDVVKERVRP